MIARLGNFPPNAQFRERLCPPAVPRKIARFCGSCVCKEASQPWTPTHGFPRWSEVCDVAGLMRDLSDKRVASRGMIVASAG